MITGKEATRLSFFADMVNSFAPEEVEERCGDSKWMEGMTGDAKEIALAMICLAGKKEYSGSGYHKEMAEWILSGSKENLDHRKKREDAMLADAKSTIAAIERRRGRK